MPATNAPMFTSDAAAANWHMPLPASYTVLAGERGWQAAYAEVCDAVEAEMLRDVEDDGIAEQVRDSVRDAVTNAWSEGQSHDDWCADALRRLR